MFDSVRPHGRQPTRLPRPWDSPGKNTGVGCHFLLQCMKVESESEVAQSCLTLCNPMDCSLPGSSIHGIFWATGVGCCMFTLWHFNIKAKKSIKLHRLSWDIEKFRFGFQSFEECKFYLVRINHSQISELPVFIWIVTGFWVPLPSKSSVFKHSVSFTLWCWGILCYSFRVEWHSMEYLDFNSNSSND